MTKKAKQQKQVENDGMLFLIAIVLLICIF